MGKKNKFARMARADALATFLLNLGLGRGEGADITVDEAYVITWRGDSELARKFYVWVDFREEVVWLGIRDTFDRWANSRDYVYEGIPDEEDFPLLFTIAMTLMAQGITKQEDCSPRSLNEHWRKAKKRRAQAERLAS